MQKIWDMYIIARELIEKLCKKKCYHLGVNTIEACYDYIQRRLEKDEFKEFKNYDSNKSKESTFLYTVISSRLIDFFNSASKKREIFDEVSISNSYYIEDKPNDVKEIIDKFIIQLSYEEQTYLQYFYNDGRSAKEIGDIFLLTPKQVAKKIENIQIKLKRKFTKANYSFEDII